MKCTVNISPCPNDTFMFHAMLHGIIDTGGIKYEARFADIEELNKMAVNGEPVITKVSCAVLPKITPAYRVLDAGSALGTGNGPLVVSTRRSVQFTEDTRIAVPGLDTTANLLMDRFFPHSKKRTPVLFSQIAGLVADGAYDAGVLIHEGRFTYRDHGLHLLYDLGQLWEQAVRVPLPLGCIVASHSLGHEAVRTVQQALRLSVVHALQNPSECEEFIRQHAREMDAEVIARHIDLFVNGYSVTLGEEGRNAIMQLTGLGPDVFFNIHA